MKFVCKVPAFQNLRAFPVLHVEAAESSVTFTLFTGKSEVDGGYYATRIYDFYVAVQVTVSAEVEEPGSASFESKAWKAFSKKEVSVSTDPSDTKTASIVFGLATQAVQVLDGTPMPYENPKPFFPMVLDLGVFEAISKDTTRPHLNCLHLQAKGGRLQVTATDGHRMHRTAAPFEGADFEMTVPRLAVAALDAIKGADDVLCAPGTIRKGATTVHFPPMIAFFPPCDRIIPQGADRTTTLPVKELLRLLKAYPKAQEIPEDNDVGNIILDVSSEGIKFTRAGYYERSIAAKTDTLQPGEVFKIGVNSIYLIEALELVGEGATMASYGDLDPLLIKNGERLAVTMPCRI